MVWVRTNVCFVCLELLNDLHGLVYFWLFLSFYLGVYSVAVVLIIRSCKILTVL